MASPVDVLAGNRPLDILHHRPQAESLRVCPQRGLVTGIQPRRTEFLNSFPIWTLDRARFAPDSIAGFQDDHRETLLL